MKIFGIITGIAAILITALIMFVLYHRSLNAKKEACLSKIELGDSSSEVIEKMRPYRDNPDWIMENETIDFKQKEQHGFTLIVYDPLFGDSGHLWFYFPPGKDSLIHIRQD